MERTILLVLIVLAIFGMGCETSQIKTKTDTRKIETKETTDNQPEPTKEDLKMSSAPEMQINTDKNYTALIETTEGNISVKFFPKDAPKTVNNFVFLAKKGYYDGTIFHRVIKDFMIQGGDPEGTGAGGPGYQFEDEINSIKLVKGKLAMANAGPNTNGSQFFIVTAQSTPWLDGKHTAFGEIIEGMDTVDKIEATQTSYGDRPTNPIKINKIAIEEK